MKCLRVLSCEGQWVPLVKGSSFLAIDRFIIETWPVNVSKVVQKIWETGEDINRIAKIRLFLGECVDKWVLRYDNTTGMWMDQQGHSYYAWDVTQED